MDCKCSTWARVDIIDEKEMLSSHHPSCPNNPKNKKIKVYKVIPNWSLAPCVEKDADAVKAWVESAEPGAVIVISVAEITEAEYCRMSEYEGP